MKFSSLILYVDDNFPTKNAFEKLKEVGTALHRKGKFLFSVDQELINERYYWMYFQYDNENLYSDTVLDTSDYFQKQNPRPKTQVELRFQLFACYDLESQTLFVSDYGKRNVVSDYISEMLQKQVSIKNIIKSIDDFLAVNKLLKSIVFTQRRNLQTTAPNSLFSKTINVYGLDLPETAKIKLDYGSTPVGIIKTKMHEWKNLHDSGELEEIIIVGMDDNGIESSFNFSTMVSSIEIALLKDENDRYDPTAVQTLLLQKIGELYGKAR